MVALLRFAFGQKIWHAIFLGSKANFRIPEAAPKASLSFSVSEKLARYGSSALSGVEHLTLLVGKESVAPGDFLPKALILLPAETLQIRTGHEDGRFD